MIPFIEEVKHKSIEYFLKSRVINLVRFLSGPVKVILNFHKVRPNGLFPDPFDTCPSISVELFRELLIYLRRYYKIVPLRNLFEIPDPKKPLLSITFDDGWKATYEIAFPILQELDIPATIFITTGKIGSPEPFWQQKLGRLFSYAISEGDIEIQQNLKNILKVGDKMPLTINLYKKTVNKWKLLKYSEIDDWLNKYQWLKQISHYDKPLFLTHDDIKEMTSKNIDVGSHTVNHVILPIQSNSIVEYELLESKKTLEEIVRKPVDMLAYPDGAFSNEIIRKAKASGFKFGFTTKNTPMGKRIDPMKCPRVDFEWELLEGRNKNYYMNLFQLKIS